MLANAHAQYSPQPSFQASHVGITMTGHARNNDTRETNTVSPAPRRPNDSTMLAASNTEKAATNQSRTTTRSAMACHLAGSLSPWNGAMNRAGRLTYRIARAPM